MNDMILTGVLRICKATTQIVAIYNQFVIVLGNQGLFDMTSIIYIYFGFVCEVWPKIFYLKFMVFLFEKFFKICGVFYSTSLTI